MKTTFKLKITLTTAERDAMLQRAGFEVSYLEELHWDKVQHNEMEEVRRSRAVVQVGRETCDADTICGKIIERKLKDLIL